MTPSPFQQAIFDHIAAQIIGTECRGAQSHLTIQAVAGSGKTTTIAKALELTDPTQRAVFLAFNKSIATELAKRVPAHVQARTFHSLCYMPVTKALGVNKVNQDKLKDICRVVLLGEDFTMYASFVRKLVGLARNAGLGALEPAHSSNFHALVEMHDLTLEHDAASIEQGVAFAQQVLTISNRTNEADFDDLLYFAVLKGITLPKFAWVFVDEAQDTNAIQRAILKKILAKNGRLVAVGDSAQAIYGFRGADSNAMKLIAEAFSPCIELPLSVTYRCATSITTEAQQFVPEIQARDGAPVGEVLDLQFNWKPQDFGSHDLVVCRNTKPLIQLGYQMMRARIPVRIMGKDIGEGLIALIRKCAKRGSKMLNLDDTLEVLANWKAREIEKAIAADNEAKAEAVDDKAGAIEMLAADLPESERTVDELTRVIQALFTDENSRTTLATIHKAKGLESDTVWWLNPSLCPSKWAKQEWQKQQERHLMYVAITRAKIKLAKIELAKGR